MAMIEMKPKNENRYKLDMDPSNHNIGRDDLAAIIAIQIACNPNGIKRSELESLAIDWLSGKFAEWVVRGNISIYNETVYGFSSMRKAHHEASGNETWP